MLATSNFSTFPSGVLLSAARCAWPQASSTILLALTHHRSGGFIATMIGRSDQRAVYTFVTTRPRSASRGNVRRVGDNLALAARDQRAKVVVPQRQRGAHLALV